MSRRYPGSATDRDPDRIHIPARTRLILSAALLTIITTVAFVGTLDNGFVNWDDDRNFLENEAFRSLGLRQLKWSISTYHLGVWQPLAWILFGVQHELGTLTPRIYHAFSLALHLFNAVVFYVLTIHLLEAVSQKQRNTHPRRLHLCAWVGALLFATHPLRVEAVAWASCQPYLPAAMFYMLAVLVYVRGSRPRSPPARRWKVLSITWVLYLCAVAFKAAAVSLPVVLLILDVYPLRRLRKHTERHPQGARQRLVEKLPFLVVAVAVSLAAAAAKDFNESRLPLRSFDPGERFAQAAYGLSFYVIKTVVPTGLSPYYRLPEDLGLTTGRFALCAGAILGLTTALISLRKRLPGALAAWMAYVVILLPNLGLVQIAQQISADRYSYLAIMPLMILLAGAMLRLGRRTSALSGGLTAVPLTAIFAIGCAALLVNATRRQVLIWHDSHSLWGAALDVDPKCAVAECNLGESLIREGLYPEASRHLARAIDLRPDFSFAYTNFAVILNEAEDYQGAVAAGHQALESDVPLRGLDLARTHAVLGQAYAGLKRRDLAMKHTKIALELGFKEARKMIDHLQKSHTTPSTASRPARDGR